MTTWPLEHQISLRQGYSMVEDWKSRSKPKVGWTKIPAWIAGEQVPVDNKVELGGRG